jgi:hypothetical protein
MRLQFETKLKARLRDCMILPIAGGKAGFAKGGPVAALLTTVSVNVETPAGILRELGNMQCEIALQKLTSARKPKRRIAMSSPTSYRLAASAIVLSGTIAASPGAIACCPGDGNGAPRAASGMGESFPQAVDLASDPAWQVYEFSRDGIRYLQINDRSGVVRAAVGRIGETFWVMPIGIDADRVSVSGVATQAGAYRSLYKREDIEIELLESANGTYWLIRSPAQAQ